jgi:hypothetical protein
MRSVCVLTVLASRVRVLLTPGVCVLTTSVSVLTALAGLVSSVLTVLAGLVSTVLAGLMSVVSSGIVLVGTLQLAVLVLVATVATVASAAAVTVVASVVSWQRQRSSRPLKSAHLCAVSTVVCSCTTVHVRLQRRLASVLAVPVVAVARAVVSSTVLVVPAPVLVVPVAIVMPSTAP